MKIAYLDCFSGVSGDMIIGALLDAGLDFEKFESELSKLNLTGYKLHTEKTSRNSISGTKFIVKVTENNVERNLKDIIELIEKSDLSEFVKAKSTEIFRKLAFVEANIHSKIVDEIHFHEVGGLDSIVDIVGSVIGFNLLGIDDIYVSKVHLGTGFIECEHGIIPVPSPATVELLRDKPVFSTGIETELTTPTGAAILDIMSISFGIMPEMEVNNVGYGAGKKDLKIPNMLRIIIGNAEKSDYKTDDILLIETNIDDMNPEIFDYVAEILMDNGALDVYTTQVIMKKSSSIAEVS